ncbi:site-specific integrase [Actinomadura sp. NBRC 104425]|uniref:tyrosine-type recombinase/integrase n=1 Tax=Actinomadura sp. NBRC 104425 TaxID=3032204 RepID=UPI0024A1DFDA|nr:tyrosine-type recombinase/integrase [Actinomadura sp. NBRC 104425]GLZ15861.1 site-specific integrase [Actinomadura sp. NBRC 104425]
MKPDGRPDRRHRKAATEAEVTRKVRELEAKRDAGKTSKPGRAPTVAEWMRTWLDTIAARKVDESTMRTTYRPKVEQWIIPGLGQHRLDRLHPDHLDAFYVSLADAGLAPNTVLQIHRILSRALKVATQREIIARNPATLVDAPQAEETETETLTAAQARTVLTIAGEQRNGTRWSVALALGLRQGEALGLRWRYVDLERGVIRVHWQIKHMPYRHGCDDPHECGARLHRWPCPEDCPKAKRTSGRRHVCLTRCPANCKRHKDGKCPKLCPPDCTGHERSCPKRVGGWRFTRPKGKRGREIPIPPPLLELLKAHKAAQDAERQAAGENWEDWDLVWCRPDGRPIDRRADWGAWKELLRAAGIQADAYRLHDARHTAGTLLGEQGVSIHVIQRILGHAQLSTTRRYTRPTDDLTVDAVGRMGAALWE